MCTNFKFKPAADGSVVVGRSMEFPDLLPYSLAVLPRGYSGAATAHSTATSSIVIEFHPDASVRIVDNPTGVGTNAPYLDWHLLNLSNYVGFNAFTPDSQSIDGLTVAAFGQGQGLNMLPGGYSPPDRFVRAAILVELAAPAQTGAEAEQMVGHLLNTFDIVPGTVLEHMGPKVVSEETTYDVIVNLSDLRFVYRTVSDPTWYCLDLAAVDFTKPTRTTAMSFSGGYTSITI